MVVKEKIVGNRKGRGVGRVGRGLVAALIASGWWASAAAPIAQTGSADFVGPLKIYTFLMGTILVPDPKDFGLKPEEVSIDRLSALSFLIVHPKGTLLWEAGVAPDKLIGTEDPAAERAMKSLGDHLGDLGYTEKGITYFAMSHAHTDHSGNANTYAGSTWLVRKAERDAMFATPVYPERLPRTTQRSRRARRSRSTATTTSSATGA